MKNIIILTIFILFSGLSLSAQKWETNFEVAQKLADTQNRNIVLVFQGSDWCAPCIKLEKEVFKTNEFRQYANDHFVLLKADFPRKKKNKLSSEQKKQNGALAEQYNRQGVFPLVVKLDKEGKVLGQTGYQKVPPGDYIKLLTSFEK